MGRFQRAGRYRIRLRAWNSRSCKRLNNCWGRFLVIEKDYDGAEWWEFKTMPCKPKKYRKPIALTVKQAKEKFGGDIKGWATLKELNSKQKVKHKK
jgi:hypothetical protein